MKYSTSLSSGLSLFDSVLGVSLSDSVSLTDSAAVPGMGTKVAVALDDDADEVSSEASQLSYMFEEKVTLFDILPALGGTLTSDQSASSYIA